MTTRLTIEDIDSIIDQLHEVGIEAVYGHSKAWNGKRESHILFSKGAHRGGISTLHGLDANRIATEIRKSVARMEARP